jgi:GntR family transcriptional repressor for pyruvate dehydrogenase complex
MLAMTGTSRGATVTGPPVTKEAFVQRLEAELLSGRLEAGTKLPSERRLAEDFGVSRPMVREAMRSLVERGLIEVMPGRGAFARQVRSRDAARPLDGLYRRQNPTARDLVEARMMLEQETASLAAARASADDVAALERALDEFDQARDVIARARADIAFHGAVARAAHNPVIETMFGSITVLTFELMLRSLGDPTVSREGVPYHHEIFAAIRARDPRRACEAMLGHLGIAIRLYGNDLDRSLDLVARRELERLLGPATTLEDIWPPR